MAMSWRDVLTCSVSVIGIFAAYPAFADGSALDSSGGAPEAGASSRSTSTAPAASLEEVVVTARKLGADQGEVGVWLAHGGVARAAAGAEVDMQVDEARHDEHA